MTGIRVADSTSRPLTRACPAMIDSCRTASSSCAPRSTARNLRQSAAVRPRKPSAIGLAVTTATAAIRWHPTRLARVLTSGRLAYEVTKSTANRARGTRSVPLPRCGRTQVRHTRLEVRMNTHTHTHTHTEPPTALSHRASVLRCCWGLAIAGAERRRSFAHGVEASPAVVRRSSSDNLEAYSRHRHRQAGAAMSSVAASAIPEHDFHVPPPPALSSHSSAPSMNRDDMDGLSAKDRVRLRKERERQQQEEETKRLLEQARRDNAANRMRAAEKERDLYSGKAAARASGLPAGAGGMPPRSDGRSRSRSRSPAAPGGQDVDADAYFQEQQKRMDAEEQAAIAAVRDYKLPGARYGAAMAGAGSDDEGEASEYGDVGYSLGAGGKGTPSSGGTKSVLEELDDFVEEGEDGVDDGVSSSDEELLAAVDVEEEGDPDGAVEAALHQELGALCFACLCWRLPWAC